MVRTNSKGFRPIGTIASDTYNERGGGIYINKVGGVGKFKATGAWLVKGSHFRGQTPKDYIP